VVVGGFGGEEALACVGHAGFECGVVVDPFGVVDHVFLDLGEVGPELSLELREGSVLGGGLVAASAGAVTAVVEDLFDWLLRWCVGCSD